MSRRMRAVMVACVMLTTAVAGGDGLDRMRVDVSYLADVERGGRMTGSEGEAAAAEYIAKQLEAMGAAPLNGNGFASPFEFTAGVHDDGSLVRVVAGEKSFDFSGTDTLHSLSFSDDGTTRGEVVFAGYGLRVPESQDFGYDSYATLDVKDKIVVVFRYFPEDTEKDVRATLSRYSGLRYKAMLAREQGAKALIILTGPRSPNAGEVIASTFDTALSGSGILAASISGEVGDRIFAATGKTVEEVQKELDSGNPHVTGFAIPGLEIEMTVKVRRERKTGHNVMAMLPATEEGAEKGYVVVGAHLDHLGAGKHGNSLARKEEQGQVHPGADDNASGVAAVLEIGRYMARKPRDRGVLLAFWSGEELGLLGSTAFVKEPPVPLEEIAAYVNFDMVGRMKENKLSLQSVGSSSIWRKVVESVNVMEGFDVRMQDDPYLPTDSAAFYQAGIPALNFFTGSHEDYHRPSDTTELINFDDLARVASFGAKLTGRLTGLDAAPDYVTVERTSDGPGSRDSMRAFTGTIPDYTSEAAGLLLGGVIAGGPADAAGLREGDLIVEFGGQKIANIYDYTYALDAIKIDEKTPVVFVREGERVETVIVPTTRK